MILGSFLFMIFTYVYFFSSLHSLFILLFLEVLVLYNINSIFFYFFPWFILLVFLTIVVSVGALGVSMLVDVTRSKGMNYFFVN